ncbi:MAG: TonB-dependent receptor plug domain-containing protein [Myxococcota bacterium]
MLSIVIALAVSQAPSNPDGGVEEELERQRVTVVTGTRTERRAADVVVPTEVITRAQIEQLGVRDLPQLLQQHPGVEMVYTNRGTGIRLQGLDPEYVLILVDGQRISGRSGSITDISRFSLREIERVEIVKGPAAALYGADAMGGVVNLITRRPKKKLEGAVRGMFGTLLEGDVRGNVGSKLGPFELRAGGGYRTRRPFDWIPSDPETSGAGIKRIDADVEAAFVPDDTLRAWVRTAYVFTDYDAVDINDSQAVFDRFQRTEQFDTWAGVRKTFSTNTTATVRGHFGLFRDQFLVDQRGSRALDEYSVNLTRLWEGFGQVDHKLENHTLTGGVEGFSELLDSTRNNPQQVQRGRVGVFLQDEWVISGEKRFSIVPGFRADIDTQFGWAPSPRVALKIDPLPQLTFRAAWGLGFRPPSFSELYLQFSNAGIGYIVRGNPKLQAERSGSVNVSVDYRLPIEGWVISGSAWHTSLTNLINITANGLPNPDDPVVFGYENVTDAYTQGVELSARMRLSRGAYLDLGYMGLDARDVSRNRPLEGRSNHRVNATLTVKYRPLGLELVSRGTFHSARPYYLGTGLGFANVLGLGEDRVIMAPAYFDLEAQLTWVFATWGRVFVNGYNLLNAGDQDFNPRPPRGVIGGVQLEL